MPLELVRKKKISDCIRELKGLRGSFDRGEKELLDHYDDFSLEDIIAAKDELQRLKLQISRVERSLLRENQTEFILGSQND